MADDHANTEVSIHSFDAEKTDRLFHYACLLFLIIVGGWLFLTRIDGSLSMWDEAYYSAIAKKSLEHDLVMFPAARPDWTSDKPALYFWMLKWSMRVFGVNSFALRFPSSLGAYAAVLLVYLIGRRFYGTGVGLIAALVLMTNKEYHVYPRNSLLDPPMIAMQLGAVWCAIQGEKTKTWHMLLGGILLGALFFLKQFLGLSVIAPIFLYWFFGRMWPPVRIKVWAMSFFLFLICGFGWFAVAWFYDRIHVESLLFRTNLADRFTADHHSDPWFWWNAFTDGYKQGLNPIFYMGCFCLLWVVVEGFRKPSPDLILIGGWLWIHFFFIHLVNFRAVHYALALYPLASLVIARMASRLWNRDWNGVDLIAVSWAAGFLVYQLRGDWMSHIPFGTPLGKGMGIGVIFGLVFLPRWPFPQYVRTTVATLMIALALWAGAFRPGPADHGPDLHAEVRKIEAEEGMDTTIYTTFFAYFHLLWYHDGPVELKNTHPDETVPIPEGEGYLIGLKQNFANWPDGRYEKIADADLFQVMKFFPAEVLSSTPSVDLMESP